MTALLSLIVLGIMLALSACAGTAGTAAPPPELLVPESARLDTFAVDRGTVASVRRHTGIVRVPSEGLNFGATAVHTPELNVRIGESVTQGQILASHNISAMERQILLLEGRIARMRREHANDIAIRELDLEIMVRDIFHEELEIDRIRMELELARERHTLSLRHELEQLEALTSQAAGSAIISSFDGVVTFINTDEWIPPFTPVIHVSPLDAPVFIEYTGAAALTPSLAQRITGHISGQEYTLTHQPLTQSQVLHYRSLGVRMPVRFLVESDNPPKAGALVSIHVYTQWEHDVLRIPRNALLFSPDEGFYVYRIENGVNTRVLISAGTVTDTFVSVLGGLEEGDIIYVRP